MFALEISFRDGVSQPEMILVRRPQALIGASDYAHVVVEDMKPLNVQLRVIRELGRKFRIKPLGEFEAAGLSALVDAEFDGEGEIDVGPVRFFITALDTDLCVRDSEPPDRAGVRILRQACSTAKPDFPAVVVGGAVPMVVSFSADQPVYIGRSNQCAVRLDSADVSAKHARLGFDSGNFWVEDLGSTNGTFVNGQQISGRIAVEPGMPIVVGREISLFGVVSEEQIERATRSAPSAVQQAVQEHRYPILISVSEVARPARLVLAAGNTVTIGRDPSSELWLGAPHVSRRHCTVHLDGGGMVTITDSSTNGTAHDSGILQRGDYLQLGGNPKVMDFGGGVTVGICFDEAQEKAFVASLGSAQAFRSINSGITAAEGERPNPEEEVHAPRRRSSAEISFAHKMLKFYRGLGSPQKVMLFLTVIVVPAVILIIASVLMGLLS